MYQTSVKRVKQALNESRYYTGSFYVKNNQVKRTMCIDYIIQKPHNVRYNIAIR